MFVRVPSDNGQLPRINTKERLKSYAPVTTTYRLMGGSDERARLRNFLSRTSFLSLAYYRSLKTGNRSGETNDKINLLAPLIVAVATAHACAGTGRKNGRVFRRWTVTVIKRCSLRRCDVRARPPPPVSIKNGRQHSRRPRDAGRSPQAYRRRRAPTS